jgi:hypothetical protein
MYVNNRTRFEFLPVPGYDKEGCEVFTNIVKGTFSIGRAGALAVADAQIPVEMADSYWGEPALSPVKYESDLALFKTTTDLVLTGSACGRGGRKTRSVEVTFGVGPAIKTAILTCAEPRERIPLSLLEELPDKRSGPSVNRFGNGLGFYAKTQPARLKYAGTYDEAWRKSRAPFLPADFNYRFFSCAYPELRTETYLMGGEKVFADGVSPEGPLWFYLPRIKVEVKTVFEHKSVICGSALDTVIFDADTLQILLLWRQMVPCHNMIKDIRGFEIDTSSIV